MKPTIFAATIALAASSAAAQEAMYTEAATMPSPGTFVLREMFHYSEHGRNPDTGSEKTKRYEWLHSLQIGLVRDLSLKIDVPMEWRTEENFSDGSDDDSSFGVSQIDIMFKWRFFKDDSGGIDTTRAALMFGAEVPSGDGPDFSGNSVNPMIGAVVTKVWGRHGFNQDAFFKWNTGGDEEFNFGGDGPSEAFTHNTAYLYRFIPERYTSESTGAWYATIELNGLYETNGDYELLWSPGIMYEGQRFGLEFMCQLPLYQAVDERPELDFRIGFGVRFAF